MWGIRGTILRHVHFVGARLIGEDERDTHEQQLSNVLLY